MYSLLGPQVKCFDTKEHFLAEFLTILVVKMQVVLINQLISLSV